MKLVNSHVQHVCHPTNHLVGTNTYNDLNTFASIWAENAEPGEINDSLYFIAWNYANEGMESSDQH